MESSQPMKTEETNALLACLEDVMARMDDALADLEHRVAEQRWDLVVWQPRPTLDKLQEIEELSARVGRLEDSRASLAAQLAATASGAQDDTLLAAARAVDAASSRRLLASRHRMLGTIARIATCNEASQQLADGLNRVVSARIDKLSKLCETGACGSPRRGNGVMISDGEAIDVRA